MRKHLILLFLVILIQLANAEKISLTINESYLKDGRNITLLDISDKKAIICVNNEKTIFSKSKEKQLNDVSFEISEIEENSIGVTININCRNCICNEDCSNTKCFEQDEATEEPEIIKEDLNENVLQKEIKAETEVVSIGGVGIFNLGAALLILFALLAGFYYLIRKRY